MIAQKHAGVITMITVSPPLCTSIIDKARVCHGSAPRTRCRIMVRRAVPSLLALFLFEATASAEPPSVSVVSVNVENIMQSSEYAGHVEAIRQVGVRARVQGILKNVALQEGQDVKANDLLFEIDPDQYANALTLAKSKKVGADANLKSAELTLDQQRQQANKWLGGSRADLDQAIANQATAAAAVNAADDAVRSAELNLAYTRIVSPLSGRVGSLNITPGDLVGPETGVLAKVVQLDPIRVVFSISEQEMMVISQQMPGATLEQINATFIPSLRLPGGSFYPLAGKIDFIGNEIDPVTRTVRIHTTFPNPAKLLLPGESVAVLVRQARAPVKRMPVVVSQAVREDRQGKFVFIIGVDNKVEQRPITATQRVGQYWLVESGLKGGEKVVVDGLDRVRSGLVVQAVPVSSPGQP